MDVYLQSETWSSRHTANRHAGTYLTRPVPTTTQSDLTRGRGHLPSLRATPGTGAAHNSRPRRPVVWIMPRTIRWFEAHVFTVVVTVPASLSSSPAMPCLHRYQFQLRSQRTGVQPSLPVLHTSRRCSAVASRCRCGPRMTQSVSLPRLPLPTARASRVGRR